MRAAVKQVLVLCAALACLPACCQHSETYPESDRAHSQCDGYPMIQVSQTQPPWLPDDFDFKFHSNVSIQFGITVTVYCFNGKENGKLIMTKNGKQLITENVIHGIAWIIKKTDHLQRWEYVCTDVETACTSSVTISVILALDVYSSRRRFSDDDSQMYIIPYGDPLSVLCTGPDATRLTMTRDGRLLPIENKNETTIQFLEKPDLQISEYVCTDVDTAYSRSVKIRVEPAIYIQSENVTISPKVLNTLIPLYDLAYGDSIEVFCFGPRAVKLISPEEAYKEILTTNGNQSTAKLFIKKLELGKLIFSCIDSEVSVYMSTVHVLVNLRIDVISNNTTLVENSKFVIKHGNPLEIICYGPAAELSISKDGIDVKELQTVNESTIKLCVTKPDILKIPICPFFSDSASKYTCSHKDGSSISVYICVKLELLTYIQLRNQTIETLDTGSIRFYDNLIYGDSIEVFCSGPRPVKLINPEEGNKELLTANINMTTAKASITILKTGRSIIHCINSEDHDYQDVVRLYLFAKLQINVLAPSIIRIDDSVLSGYIIKYGDSLEIYCSGPDVEHLSLFENNVEIKELQTINETTRKWTIRKSSTSFDGYVCSTGETQTESFFYIDADVIPVAEGFRCVSHNVMYLNCTWSVLSNSSNFTLYYVENGSPTRICTNIETPIQTKFCVWYAHLQSPSYSRDMTALSFLIQSCNLLGCSNQTFLIDHVSIVKSVPPRGLTVHNTSTRGAVLRWYNADISCAGELFWSQDGDFHYKVEYWHSGIQPLEVNSSLVSCTSKEDCNIELKLPCPGLTYQVWVYQKLKKAIGEEFWSDPSSIVLHTDNESNEDDPTCDETPRKTKDVMKYFVQELRKEVRQDLRRYGRKKVRSLKAKRDKTDRRHMCY